MEIKNTHRLPDLDIGELFSFCPNCGARAAQSIFKVHAVPANCSALWSTSAGARACATGSIELRECPACSLVFNAKFDAGRVEYDANYDNSLDFSPAFQTYMRELCERLCRTYGLQNKRIVEIGCGSGTFLKQLCAAGNNTGRGYDPSFPGDSNPLPGVSFAKEYFGQQPEIEFDFFCCRHVLEHIEKPLEFLRNLARMAVASPAAVFYFEVPDASAVLADGKLWDVIYPHACYFTAGSLRNLFERAGFEVLQTGNAFRGQFLYIEARIASRKDGRREIESFARRFDKTVREWSACLDRLAARGKPYVLWGAGAKGVTFLNLVPGARRITNVIDSNPRKQHMFVPGTGQSILPPEYLRGINCSAVILLNAAYRHEIHAKLKALGVTADIITSPDFRCSPMPDPPSASHRGTTCHQSHS